MAGISVVSLVALAALSACDTGDGKQLQEFDPADYPSQTTVVVTDESAFTIDPTGGFELPGTENADGTTEPFSVIAPWVAGGNIDARHTCDDLDISPALSWGAVPAGTAEIAIAMVDESAVSDGQPFVHWVVGGLDPSEIALVEGDVPLGALQALNSFGDVGYGGPCPPPGDEPHLYRITAYALNQQLELADGDSATEFLATIATISIASTDVTGIYQR
jgi:Raf kinase inhibitor-like YbhB/YbcL family protein